MNDRQRAAVPFASAGFASAVILTIELFIAHNVLGVMEQGAFSFYGLWTVAFVIYSACVCGLTQNLLQGRSWWIQWSGALLFAALATLIWVLFFVWAASGQVRLVNMPIVYFWLSGAIVAMFVSLISGERLTLTIEREKISPLKGTLLILAGVSFCLLGTAIAWAIFIFSGLIFPSRLVFELPRGYLGPVLVIYNQPDGLALIEQWRERIYPIPANGFLPTSFPGPQGYNNYVFRYAADEKTYVEIKSSGYCNEDVSDDVVRACILARNDSDNALCNFPVFEAFIIDRPPNWATHRETFQNWKQEFLVPRMPHDCPNPEAIPK